MRHQPGFTLVELMVTIALLAFLLMIAAPYTSAWANNARLLEGQRILEEGIGRAKALALRNPNGRTVEDSTPAALLCLDSTNRTLSLYAPAGTSCTGTARWTARLPNGFAAKVGTQNLASLPFDNRGLLVAASASPSMSSTRTLSLSVGQETADVRL